MLYSQISAASGTVPDFRDYDEGIYIQFSNDAGKRTLSLNAMKTEFIPIVSKSRFKETDETCAFTCRARPSIGHHT